MATFQEELTACREYAEQGYQLADESFDKMKLDLHTAQDRLLNADSKQGTLSRLEKDPHFEKQLRNMKKLQQQTVDGVGENLRSLKDKMGEFTIVLYGRTMAGKSTLMEILRRGDGSSIGKGAQRTTLDVRAYHWNGLKIFDVPGTCSFGGEQDDKLAFEAAKDADLALFLLTDDAPQPYEAERLGELKKLGKPVLGIVNVKQVLSPDRASAKRKLDLRQLDKKIHDQSRLEEIVRQFKQFSVEKGYNFEDVPFVYSHLQSAFFSQRENDDELYRLSNFSAVENFILEKVRSDGKFIRIKTFIDAVARPMQASIAALYAQSADTVLAWKSYIDKINQLNNWRRGFTERTQTAYNTFMDTLSRDMNTKINYVVNNYYESEYAGDHWKDAVDSLNINERCQNFIRQIGEEASTKMHELSDELVQDLNYSGTNFIAPQIYLPDTGTFLRDVGKLAPLLALTPVGWVGAAAFGLFSLIFGDSKEEKIREAKNELREKLGESRDEILSNVGDSVIKVINEEIFGKQIDGFYNTLFSMADMLENLSYAQNSVADTLNHQYGELNFQLLVRAAQYSQIGSDELSISTIARIVGEEFFFVNSKRLSESNRQKLSELLGEKLSVCKVGDETYFDDVVDYVQRNILGCEFGFDKFVEDEDNGDMYLIHLPGSGNFTDEEIQLTQQIFDDPVILN
ncbi:MAG: 50S ribosome-binding GTPase [Selenomonadaceae bacterium]|nr:50S ribosome-binding GTPase [Selenomonadaceae bacterium]